MNDKIICPNCGGDVRWYHTSEDDRSVTSRAVCQKKCQDWYVIKQSNSRDKDSNNARH